MGGGDVIGGLKGDKERRREQVKHWLGQDRQTDKEITILIPFGGRHQIFK